MTVKAHPFRHHLSKWPIVMPLYDGRQCPMCSAVVLGWRAQQLHEGEHNARAEWEEWAVATIYALAEKAGLELGPHPSGEEFGDMGTERLTAKARRALGYVIGSGELPAETRGGED